MKWCQLALFFWLLAMLLCGLHSDTNGRSGRPPGGFKGVIGTLLVVSVVALTLYGAGAFSEWLR